jgi:hypothetical protein
LISERKVLATYLELIQFLQDKSLTWLIQILFRIHNVDGRLFEWIIKKEVVGVRFGYKDKVEISSSIHIIMNLRMPQNKDGCGESMRDFNIRRRTMFYRSNYIRPNR